MSVRKTLKRLVFAFAGSPSLIRCKLSEISAANALTILNLHGINDDKKSLYCSLTPKLFEEWLGWLRSVFHIVTFGELETLPETQKPLLILSFDNGYKDFIDTVAPILAKHGLRANQNVIPGCVKSGRPPMNVILQDFISTAPAALLRELSIPGIDVPIDPEKRSAFCARASAALKNRPIAEQKEILARLLPVIECFDGLRPTAMMTSEDVAEIARVHEVGVHSYEHASMAYETDEYLRQDVIRCRDWFAKHLNRAPQIYAFPNGSMREGQADLVGAEGYATVLAVGEKFSRPQAAVHTRFTFYADALAEARYRSVGNRTAVAD